MTILMKLPPKVPQQLTHTIFPMPLNLTPDKVVAIIVKESECLTDKNNISATGALHSQQQWALVTQTWQLISKFQGAFTSASIIEKDRINSISFVNTIPSP